MVDRTVLFGSLRDLDDAVLTSIEKESDADRIFNVQFTSGT